MAKRSLSVRVTIWLYRVSGESGEERRVTGIYYVYIFVRYFVDSQLPTTDVPSPSSGFFSQNGEWRIVLAPLSFLPVSVPVGPSQLVPKMVPPFSLLLWLLRDPEMPSLQSGN